MTSLEASIERYGANTTSFQALEPGTRAFPFADGAIAYVDTGLAWVAIGDPLVAETERVDAALAFARAARRSIRASCLFATERGFAEAATKHGFRSLLVGEQPVFEPSRWPASLSAHKSLREQLRRARAKGVRVRRVDEELSEDGPMRAALRALLARFVASRRMAQMGFVVTLDPFGNLARKASFVAEREGELVGYLGVVPIPARNGWFFEDLVRDRHAPNGTAELLIDAAMRAAHEAGVTHVTLGLAALSGDISATLRKVRDLTRFLYDFRGLRRFKEKLGPVAFEPVYLTYPAREGGVVATLAMLHAFANGSFVGFGLRTLARNRRLLLVVVFLACVVAGALACLLS